MACVTSCPSRRPVRPADRGDARARRAGVLARARRPARCAALLFARPPLPAPAARRAARSRRSARRLPLPGRLGALLEIAPPWRSTESAAAPHARAGETRGRVGAPHRLRPARRLRRRQRRDGPRARRRRLRGRRAARQGCCGALSIHAGRRDEGRARAAADRGVRAAGVDRRRQRLGLRLAPEGLRAPPRRRSRLGRARSAFSERVRDVSELLAERRAPRAAAAARPARRVPGLLPPPPCAGDSALPRGALAARDPRARGRRAGRAGHLLRQRRDLQPRPAGGGRASSATARRANVLATGAQTPTRARTPAASSRSRRRCAERAARCRRSTRSSSSTRRSGTSARRACCARPGADRCLPVREPVAEHDRDVPRVPKLDGLTPPVDFRLRLCLAQRSSRASRFRGGSSPRRLRSGEPFSFRCGNVFLHRCRVKAGQRLQGGADTRKDEQLGGTPRIPVAHLVKEACLGD